MKSLSKELVEVGEAEKRLSALAASLDVPVPDEQYVKAVIEIGHRSRAVFTAFAYAAEGPSPSGAMNLLRPIVEMNIVLRFFKLDPELHVDLWEAEGHRQALALLADDEQYGSLKDRSEIDALLEERGEEIRKKIGDARARALAAGVMGVGDNGKVFPSPRDMVRQIAKQNVWNAYLIAYRSMSWNTHAGKFAFGVGGFEQVGGLLRYSDRMNPDTQFAVRSLAVTVFASTLAIVSKEIGIQVSAEADQIRRRFVNRSSAGLDTRDGSQLGGNGS